MKTIIDRMGGVLRVRVSGRFAGGNAAALAEAVAADDDDRAVILDCCPVSAARAPVP